MAEAPRPEPPRFPGYDVLSQSDAWDEVTRAVVLRRVTPPTVTFFAGAQEASARALIDRLLAQEDETPIPVFEMVDQRLASGIGDGYRYEELPEDGEAWRASIGNLDDEAMERHGRPFHGLERSEQMTIIDDVQGLGGADWRGLRADRVFELWLRYCCEAMYSHPSAWNEIGFGGPAYPRGYLNLGLDRREHWEVAEEGASDPVPWAARAEAARARTHEGTLSGRGGQGGAETK